MNVSRFPDRILMTADTVGGVFDYAAELSRALSRRGVEVLLATMGAPLSPSQVQVLAAIDRLKVFESRFKLEWMEEPWAEVDQAAEWLLEIENTTRPDLVHLNGYAHGAAPWRSPCLVAGHSCVLSWWRDVLGEPAPARLAEYRRRVRRGLRHAGAVVAPSRAMLRSLRALYGSFERGRVIYNGRDALDFQPALKEPFVFSMGRLWDEAKNVRLLDEAAAHLPWPVLVAGNVEQDGARGRNAPRRLKHAESLGLLDAQNVRSMLGRASIYVHPARYEPFGLAVLEAALSGCALVVGDIPSLREIWQDAAVYVPIDDAARLARELEGLIEDADRRAFLASRAREVACRFSPERMASRYLSAYREMLGTWRVKRDEENPACA
jgi:glycosyltransferase involved in cell wall biosynthesis